MRIIDKDVEAFSNFMYLGLLHECLLHRITRKQMVVFLAATAKDIREIGKILRKKNPPKKGTRDFKKIQKFIAGRRRAAGLPELANVAKL